MHEPLFLLYQQPYVTEMYTKPLNEKPVDMSTEMTGKHVGPQLNVQFCWLNRLQAAMRCLMAVRSFRLGMAAGNMDDFKPPLPSLPLYKHKSRPVMDEAGRSLPSALFMEAESTFLICPRTVK